VARATTATFVPPEAKEMPGYTLLASPTLYPGQTVRADVVADARNDTALSVRLLVQSYGAEDKLVTTYGPDTTLAAGAHHGFEWRVPDMGGQPIATVGLEIAGAPRGAGTIYLDFLTWDGAPDVAFVKPAGGGTMWRHAWVNGVDQYDRWWPETYRMVHNEGVGLLIQGTREWTDYRFEATVTPHMALSCGIAVRVQGMRRYAALLLAHRPDGRRVLKFGTVMENSADWSEADFDWELYQGYRLALEVSGNQVRASVDGAQPLEPLRLATALDGGGVAMVCEEGRAAFDDVVVRPVA
jgi:hypothetical protein